MAPELGNGPDIDPDVEAEIDADELGEIWFSPLAGAAEAPVEVVDEAEREPGVMVQVKRDQLVWTVRRSAAGRPRIRGVT